MMKENSVNFTVIKRNGDRVPFQPEKANKPAMWACENLEGCYPSQIVMRANRAFHDGMATDAIHTELINAARDLISLDQPNMQYAAGRLNIFQMRKHAFGEFEVPALLEQVKKSIDRGVYDPEILNFYSEDEINEMDSWLDHDRDMDFAYAATYQLSTKYLVRHRVTGQLMESTQQAYVLIGACLFSAYPEATRMGWVRLFYEALSAGKISLPTPIMVGVRTPTRQFSSCVKVNTGDSLRSINATASAIVEYISHRAGIGIHAGRLRGKGASIRNGEAQHTGVTPFFKHFQTAVGSCSQGGVREGSANLTYPFWHYEVEEILVLKNNKGTEENRVRHLDYTIQFNQFFYDRLKAKGTLTCFSPDEVPDLYDAFYADQAKFVELYEQYEQDPNVRKRAYPIVEIASLFASERSSTSRIYVQHVDHCNDYGPFIAEVAPIEDTNLCVEIALPTKPLDHIFDEEGEIALCTLSAFNLAKVTFEEIPQIAELLVRALDALLDYQDYQLPAARVSGQKRRPLGVGVTGLATLYAMNGVKYSDDSANNLTHRWFERIQYSLIKASNVLAKEFGPCELFHETKWAQGSMPIDRYVKAVDELHSEPLHEKWDELREDVVEFGLRNSTLSALMPCETSSAITNTPNGIEPPRGFLSIKANKDGLMPMLLPSIEEYKDQYELAWNMKTNKGYLNKVAIMQKFTCQSISANTYHDPQLHPNDKLPLGLILRELGYAHRMGVKTVYYHNTRDGNEDGDIERVAETAECEGGACKL